MKPILWLRKVASAASSSSNGFTPRSQTRPEVGGSSVPTMERSVLFPEPLGPSTARFSPRWSVNDTPERMRSGSPGVGYSLTMSSTTRSASEVGLGMGAIVGGKRGGGEGGGGAAKEEKKR